MADGKICTKCETLKSWDEFSKNKGKSDGHHSWCKKCANTNKRAYRRTEKGKAARRKYKCSEEGMASNKRYYLSEKGKAAARKYSRTKKGKETSYRGNHSEAGKRARDSYYQRHKKDHKAHGAVGRAVEAGILPHISTQRCKDCETAAIDYHHHLGYEKEHWLDVIPLCRKCHQLQHEGE